MFSFLVQEHMEHNLSFESYNLYGFLFLLFMQSTVSSMLYI